jgi:hypothetical protein
MVDRVNGYMDDGFWVLVIVVIPKSEEEEEDYSEICRPSTSGKNNLSESEMKHFVITTPFGVRTQAHNNHHGYPS